MPNKYPIPLLAPAYQPDICPHPDERWELRTKPFGCRASSFTSFAVAIAVLSSLVAVLLLWLCGIVLGLCCRGRRRRRARKWKRTGGETEPLLGQRGEAAPPPAS